MRVKGRPARRLGHEEGAVVYIVAISLLFLLGMLVLVFDLGRIVATRREMVRAADAAALAAAQQCAMGNGSVAARGAAAALLVENRAGAALLQPGGFTVDPACDGVVTTAGIKKVTVRARVPLDMFFAPIFGVSQTTVTARATAIWTVPGIVPITVNAVPLEPCDVGETCAFAYPKGELENPRWGILDLSLWGQGDVSSCPVPNSTVVDIIQSGGIPKDALDPWPEPGAGVYDCIDNGAQFASWDALVGGTWWFPVISVPESKGFTKPGRAEPCTGADIPSLQLQGKDCRITTAYVVDFVRLKVISLRIVPGTGGTIELTMQRLPFRGSVSEEIRLVD
jgi:Flp pilus assembly protein TadG